MNTRIAILSLTLFGAALGAPPPSAETASSAKILLSIEPVLVDANGLHPLTGPADYARVELGGGGARYQIVELDADRSDQLVYKLSYTPVGADRIKLSLERSRHRRGVEETLPPASTEISVLDTWSATVFDDPARKRRVVLRVLPELRISVDDEPLDSSRFLMRLEGGPLIRYVRDREPPRVEFSRVNLSGSGFEFGIEGFGVVRLHLRPFPGASKVGWVRGSTMGFDVGGQSFQAWSIRQILPDDPDRPGKGWVLYGTLSPLSEARDSDGYYGYFSPGK